MEPTTEGAGQRQTEPDRAALIAELEANEKAAAVEQTEEQVADKGGDEDPKAEAQDGEKPKDEAKGLGAATRREKQVRERERAVQQAAAAQQTKEAEIAKREAELAARERRFVHDPVGVLADMGVKEGYARYARKFYAHELGADAPKELREQIEQESAYGDVHREIKELKAALAERDRRDQEREKQQEAASQRAGAISEIQDELGKAGERFGNIADLSDPPAQVAEEILDFAMDYARRNPGEDLSSAETIFELYDKHLARQRGRFKSSANSTTSNTAPTKKQTKQAEEKKPANPTLNKDITNRTKSRGANSPSREELIRELEELDEQSV